MAINFRMNKLFKSNIILIFIFFTIQLNGQISLKKWEGKWKGTVETWSYNSKIDSFAMSIDITQKDSIWDFVIFYAREHLGKPDIRNYKLITVDKSKYHFAIDEKNSILLDCFFNNNCLYNKFSGMGSDLQVRMCLDGKVLDYEITSFYSLPIRTSGNQVIQKDTVPEIKSYDLYHLMKAKLKKEK